MIHLALGLLAAIGSSVSPPPAPGPPATADTGVQIAPQVPSTSDPALDAMLVEIDRLAEGVTDLTASFEQTKTTPLLRKPLVSKGTVKVKGPRVRWDTSTPHATVMLVDPAQVRIYYPEQNALEVYDLDDSLRRLTASPIPRLKTVRETFDIARAPEQPADGRLLKLSLTARSEDFRSHLAALLVTLDRDTGLATRVEMTDPDGETTTIAFSGTRTGVGLRDSDIDLTTPDGTRISKPLEGLRRAAPTTRAEPGAGGAK